MAVINLGWFRRNTIHIWPVLSFYWATAQKEAILSYKLLNQKPVLGSVVGYSDNEARIDFVLHANF